MDLGFNITKQIMKRTDKNIIVNKSKNYLNCIFTFDSSEWDDIEKFAIFKDSWGNTYRTLLGNENICECPVPNDVLKGTNFKVSIYGGDLITTNELNVILIPSGYTTKFSVPGGEDDKDVFVKIFEELDSKVDHVTLDDDTITVYAKNKIICEILLSPVAVSGDYNDLNNIPSVFNPTPHNHITEDISNFDEGVGVSFRLLANLIRRTT